jgi:hypothetical protein
VSAAVLTTQKLIFGVMDLQFLGIGIDKYYILFTINSLLTR